MSTVLTSIHGKRLGIDSDGYLTGDILGIKVPAIFNGPSGSETDPNAITSATVSSTGTNISAGGLTTLTSTVAKNYVLTDPAYAGQRKVISQTSSSTAAKIVTTSGTTNGTGFDGLNHIATFLGRGQALALQALSTAGWAVVSKDASVTLTTA